MTQSEIKAECELIYAQIKRANERLGMLRVVCKHETTFKGNYSYRIGVILPSVICSDCGELLKYL